MVLPRHFWKPNLSAAPSARNLIEAQPALGVACVPAGKGLPAADGDVDKTRLERYGDVRAAEIRFLIHAAALEERVFFVRNTNEIVAVELTVQEFTRQLRKYPDRHFNVIVNYALARVAPEPA